MQRARARRLRVVWLTPSLLIKRLRVDDVIRADGSVTVKWNAHPYYLNSNSVTGTFNCLGTAPFHDLLHHAPEAQQYALQELTSYFAFALSRFRNVINEPAAGGLSGAVCRNWCKSGSGRRRPACY
jgi:hypothetical protein